MNSLGHDFDSPIQDADIEMADLQTAAGRASKLRKKGICTHGWIHAPDFGPATCKDCGKVFPSREALFEEREELLS